MSVVRWLSGPGPRSGVGLSSMRTVWESDSGPGSTEVGLSGISRDMPRLDVQGPSGDGAIARDVVLGEQDDTMLSGRWEG